MTLNEEFYLKRGRLQFGHNNRATFRDCIYIDPETSETQYYVKDELKPTGAIFSSLHQTWAWPLETPDGTKLDLDTVLNDQVKPGIEILKRNTRHHSVINPSNFDKTLEDIRQAAVDGLSMNVEALDSMEDNGESNPEAEYLKQRLNDFQKELLDAVSMDEFQSKLQPVLDFARKTKFGDITKDTYEYSIGNIISAYLQDPEATDIRTAGDWKIANREIVPNAITVWYTTPTTKRVHNSAKARAEVARKFCDDYKVSSIEDLNINQQSLYNKEIHRRVEDNLQFKPTPHYDVRFTRVQDGKTDLYGELMKELNGDFDEKSEGTAATAFYLKVVVRLCHRKKMSLPPEIETLARSDSSVQEANIGAVRNVVRILAQRQLFSEYIAYNKTDAFKDEMKKDKDMLKKQVEICTWLVMKYLNYDVPTSIDKMNFWKMGHVDVITAFNKVSTAATKIYSEIKDVARSMRFDTSGQADTGNAVRQRKRKPAGGISGALSESRIISLLSVQPWTGEQIAEHFGVGHLYGKQLLLKETKIKNTFFGILDRMK